MFRNNYVNVLKMYFISKYIIDIYKLHVLIKSMKYFKITFFLIFT
jgi:hypothetical protein